MSEFVRFLSFRGYEASIARADLADWITVCAYCLAAVLAARAARAAGMARVGREREFWLGMVGLMLFFAVNEILDLQTILTAVGKAWAQAGGWYHHRRVYQSAFVLALALGTIAAALLLMWSMRGTHWTVRFAMFGLVFIGVFVLIRAASLHHVDEILAGGWSRFDVHWDPEMIGIALVAVAAYTYRRVRGRKALR